MGREIRRVPANWEHPKEYVEDRFGNIKQEYVNMVQGDFEEEIREFHSEVTRYRVAYDWWLKGIIIGFDWKTGALKSQESIEEYCDRKLANMKQADKNDTDNKILIARYKNRAIRFEDMFDVPQYPTPSLLVPYGEWYQLYQNVGEGTPLSPPFETANELIEWLVNNDDFWGKRWTRTAAELIVRDGYAPSAVFVGGDVYRPHNMVDLT